MSACSLHGPSFQKHHSLNRCCPPSLFPHVPRSTGRIRDFLGACVGDADLENPARILRCGAWPMDALGQHAKSRNRAFSPSFSNETAATAAGTGLVILGFGAMFAKDPALFQVVRVK